MKNKFSLGLSVVALLILLSVVWNINLNRPPREMSLHIQPLAGETRFKLYYDIGKGFGEAYSTVSVAKPGATLVGFDLPAEPLRKIRIDIGYATGTICIESIDFGPQHWSADAILTGFKPIRDINSFSKIGDCACAVAYDNHPELLSQGDFKDVYTAIDAMTGSRSLIVKTLISVLALGIAIGIFLWLQRSAAGKRVESAFARLPYDRVLIAAMFITALWLPLIGNLFGIAPSLPQTENRRLRRAPDLTEIFLSRFPDEFNGYYNDNFGFRNLLIRWNSILRYEGLNVSTRPEVIVGKDHWLFYNADVDRGNGITMRDYQGLEHFTQDQLRRIRTKLEAHRDTLARYGILYLVAVAPNKCSIYDEYMPSAINRIGPTTRQDQLIQYLSLHPGVGIVDLRPVLRDQKSLYPTYFRNDTHWNEYGAYLAYAEIIRNLDSLGFPYKPLELTDFTVTTDSSAVGDLAQMLALPDLIPDLSVNLSRKSGHLPDPGGKLVFVCDSFGARVIPFFSQHFNPVVRFGHAYDMKMILDEKPRVVVQLIVERQLDLLL